MKASSPEVNTALHRCSQISRTHTPKNPNNSSRAKELSKCSTNGISQSMTLLTQGHRRGLALNGELNLTNAPQYGGRNWQHKLQPSLNVAWKKFF